MENEPIQPRNLPMVRKVEFRADYFVKFGSFGNEKKFATFGSAAWFIRYCLVCCMPVHGVRMMIVEFK